MSISYSGWVVYIYFYTNLGFLNTFITSINGLLQIQTPTKIYDCQIYTYVVRDAQVYDSVMADVMKQIAKNKAEGLIVR